MDFSKFDNAINTEDMAKQIEEAKNNPQYDNREVPAGEYTVKLEKMEIAATKDGRPMFKVMCRILDGEYAKWCLFMNRVIAGTKNDANMIASVVGWLENLDTEAKPEFKNYTQFVDNVLDIYEEVADSIELSVEYDPKAFNSISIVDIFDI